jgi:hypothetical protein
MKTYINLRHILTVSAALFIGLAAGCSKQNAASSPKPAAPTLIEPGVGIGGVRGGMTAQEVIAELGEPAKTNGNRLVYSQWGLWVGLGKDDGSVVNLQCRDTFAGHTKEGIGIGSSQEEIIQACGKPHNQNSPKPGRVTLFYNKLRTRFFLKDGKVDGIMLMVGNPKKENQNRPNTAPPTNTTPQNGMSNNPGDAGDQDLPAADTAEQLKKLQSLYDQGQINKDEYEKKKKEIVDSL